MQLRNESCQRFRPGLNASCQIIMNVKVLLYDALLSLFQVLKETVVSLFSLSNAS